MGLSDFGNQYDDQAVEQFGESLLNKYGVLACEEAAKLEQSTLSEGSLSSYKPQVRQVINRAGESDPPVRTVIEIIKDSDKKSNTKSIMVSALRKYYEIVNNEKADKFFREAKQSEIDAEAFKGRMDVKEWITEDEVERINKFILPDSDEHERQLESSGKIYHVNHKHKALFQTLYYTGCRVGEVELLDIDDIDFDDNRVDVYRLKKSGEKPKRDIVAVPEELLDTLETFIDKYRKDDDGRLKGQSLFNCTKRTIERKIKDISKAYKFCFGDGFSHADKMTPHKLRHARVTAIANQAGLESAGEFVDHASPETTKGYRHLAAEEQREMLPEEQSDSSEKIAELLSDEDISEEKIEAIKELTRP